MTRSILHSKATVEWGTPDDIIARAVRALGGLPNLDPMTSAAFNLRVGAERIFTKDDDGLSKPWIADRLFINPAGGLIREAWEKLCREVSTGHVKKAVWIGFSVEQLCLLADPKQPNETDEDRWRRGEFYPLDFSTLITRKRISFVRGDGFKGGPTHGNFITGIGIDHAHFEACFGSLGHVIAGGLAEQ